MYCGPSGGWGCRVKNGAGLVSLKIRGSKTRAPTAAGAPRAAAGGRKTGVWEGVWKSGLIWGLFGLPPPPLPPPQPPRPTQARLLMPHMLGVKASSDGGGGAGAAAGRGQGQRNQPGSGSFHLLKNMFYFPTSGVNILSSICLYWTYFLFSSGRKQMAVRAQLERGSLLCRVMLNRFSGDAREEPLQIRLPRSQGAHTSARDNIRSL